ncbi:MAG: TetR/AcrR family transcriptional regulator [Acidobacteriota bacterium]
MGRSRSNSDASSRPYHHGDLRTSLLDAASILLEANGAQALSLRQVAREAGVSHAAPYRHFNDRHGLLEALAMRGFEALEQRLDEVTEAYPDHARRQVVKGCRAYVAEALAWPQRTHLMFGGFIDPTQCSTELTAAIDKSFGKLVALVERGEGTLFRELPTLDLVLGLWSTTHGFATLATSGQLYSIYPGSDPEDLAERIVEQMLSGITRPSA